MPGAVPLVGGARLPLAFIALGLGALAGASLWLAAQPEMLRWPQVHPAVVALAHLWLPGFLLSICFGAVYQLAPVVLGTPLRLPLWLGWAHLALHAAGVAVLVLGFAGGNFAVAGAGGALVSAGVAIFATAIVRTFATSVRRDAIAWSLPLAASWLVATVAAGLVLAINRRAPFLAASVIDLLEAHAHLGLAGFFVTLLQGATFRLVPMFTLAEMKPRKAVTAGLALSQLGLLVLVPGLASEWRAAVVSGALMLASGIGCSGAALGSTLRARRRRVLEPGVRAFVVGAALLGLTTMVGVGLVLAPNNVSPVGAMSYGVAGIVGALSFMVLGMLCKIVPFLVWMRVYGPRAGRQPVPLATALGSRRLELGWLVAHLAATVFLLAGVASGSGEVAVVGTLLLLAAAALFLGNMARVARHLLRAQTGPGAPTRAATAIS